MKHEPYCNTNISCPVYHANGICPDKRPCDCGAEDILKKGFVQGGETEFDIYHSKTMPLSTACPITNSSFVDQHIEYMSRRAKAEGVCNHRVLVGYACTECVRVKQKDPCPLTNSSHEKALVRVAERVRFEKYTVNEGQLREAIQVLCSCGHIISENEIKPLTRN